MKKQTQSAFANFSDEQLIKAHMASPKQAEYLGEIYRRYQKKVYKQCLKLVRNEAEAADLRQDIFIKTFDKINYFRFQCAFGSWLYRIAQNHCLNYIERNKKYHAPIEEVFGLAADEIDYTKKKNAFEERYTNVQKAMGSMDALTQKMLKLKYFDNYAIEELMAEFGLGKSAVKMRLMRARKKIQHSCPSPALV